MKFAAIALFAMIFSPLQSNAQGTCINISGTYKIGESSAERFTQNGCVGLRIEFGQISPDGKVMWSKIPVKTLLNGVATCDTFGCVNGAADSSKIQLARDNAWATYDLQHGDCSFNQESFSIGSNGSLVQQQNVYQCHEGYSGLITATLVPLK